MLSAALAVVLLCLCGTARAQMPLDVDPLHARLLVVGDHHLEDAFGRRLKRRLREDLPTWKVAVVYVDLVDAAAVDKLIREDDAVVVVAGGWDQIVVSTAAQKVAVGDLSQVDAVARLIVAERGRRCVWLGPPKMLGLKWRRFAGADAVSDKLGQAIRAHARGCEYIDSLAYTRGDAGRRYEDGLRQRPEPAQQWAEEIAARLVRLVR